MSLGGVWTGARACGQKLVFLKIGNLVFLLAVNFSDLESRCFDLLELGGQRYTLDFESYPVLAEHISQYVADLADGTLRPDRSQNVINHARRSNGRYRGRRYGNSHFDHNISRRGLYDDGDEDQFLQTSHQRTVKSRGDRGKTGKTRCFRRSRAYESEEGDSGKG